MADSISDFITIIRNASRARKEACTSKYANIYLKIGDILKQEGFIRDIEKTENESGRAVIRVTLKYVEDQPAITGLKRVSKPGRRLYYQHREIPRILGGIGVGILTTSKGLMNDREARRQQIGGEFLCAVW